MNTELLKNLRETTGAGIKDCRDALIEANDDLQKAIDIVKAKGLNVVAARASKVAAEGSVETCYWKTEKCLVCVEVNCQTDFVASSQDFKDFLEKVTNSICLQHDTTIPFSPTMEHIEKARQELVAKTKENIVIRRWWIEEVFDPNAVVVAYNHSNKLAAILSLKASDDKSIKSGDLQRFGVDLAMQVAAMNPLALSPEKLPAEEVNRQKNIFEMQLKELNKPEASWPKILEGKIRKWNSEVCLLNQESITHPKQTVAQVIEVKSKELGTAIELINFIRVQVGEGIETTKEDLASEVHKLAGAN